MKVIFLDIDGVLNVIEQGRDEYGQLFHPHLEDNLREVINKTDAKIVVSSTWRMSGLDIMKEMWEKRNLPGEVIDITPNLKRGIRGEEIEQWLQGNKNITNYCIIDDNDDILESQRNNFVLTSNNIDHEDCVDLGYGLTKQCAQQVIKILNKK
jgi:hypothetical protein